MRAKATVKASPMTLLTTTAKAMPAARPVSDAASERQFVDTRARYSVWRPMKALSGLLLLGAALISGMTILQGIQPHDEGLMLQAAARIAGGELPYRDF